MILDMKVQGSKKINCFMNIKNSHKKRDEAEPLKKELKTLEKN